uniref:NADH-ubiquinone oxidoreductase chain 3 n=1 Tax=Trigonidium sjostedti TaxID=1914573 RepID=A0A1J0M4L0_9ORTH|nr:NADH dehydrogenase subunit 3 [Trigonidium sjostedti]APD14948.1 NADH dehydrogenase subunit 3 [Trigonidium sjostedti]
MLFLMFMFMIILIITSLLMLISSLLSKKSILDREKNSPFECGFDPKSSARTPFSLHFFLIALIFLIFDVEITLILPIFIIINHSNILIWLLTSLFFLIILLLGLFYEWKNGALIWVN